MLKKLLKKAPSNESFLKELLESQFDKKSLQDMIYNGKININHKNEKGESFLHICLENKKIDASIWLLSNNISVNTTDKEGNTPFNIAVKHQNHRIVSMILDIEDIDIDQKDQFGRTLLQDAVVLGDHEMARILLSHHADVNTKDNKNRNVLFDALSYGNKEFIDFLLSFDELELNNIDTDQNTIMHHTLVKEDDELAKKLIEKGADPTIKDKDGNTFLCDSALKGLEGLDLVKKAISKGSNINSTVANENSILMELIKASNGLTDKQKQKRASLFKMAKELINQGININALNKDREHALFRAVRVSDEEQVSFLLASGIEVNVQNIHGETPLSTAVYKGEENLHIISLLIEHGAITTLKNKNDKTIFEVLNDIILYSHGNKPLQDQNIKKQIKKDGHYFNILKELLADEQTDLNILDSKGRPLFFTPMLYNNLPLFKFYKNAKVDMHMLNKDGQNLFFEYVMKTFEDDNTNIDFQSALSMLISAKIDHNAIEETGWTVVSKIIGTTTCNLELFKTLVKVVRFDYKVVDKLGRTAVHTAIWSSNVNIIKVINYVDKDIKNIPDHYGILPIIYAALLGDRKVVSLFINLHSKIQTDVPISKAAIKKFSPMLKNLEKLTHNIEDKADLKNMQSVISQVMKDFKIIEE